MAQDESDLFEARNRVDDQVGRMRREFDQIEKETQLLHLEFEEAVQQLDEVEREEWALHEDKRLLEEIEAQVEPVLRRRLVERERRLHFEEEELKAQEADCEEKEAQFLPAYQQAQQAVLAVRQRQQDIDKRIEESCQQQRRLLQQFQDLGEIDAGLQLDDATLQRDSTAFVEGHAADIDWSHSLQPQQTYLRQMEVDLLQLKEQTDSGNQQNAGKSPG